MPRGLHNRKRIAGADLWGPSPEDERFTASCGIAVLGVNTNGALSSLKALISFTHRQDCLSILELIEWHRRVVGDIVVKRNSERFGGRRHRT